MADQILRNRMGQQFATIKTLSNGNMEIRPYPSGNLKGVYNPRTNETRDYPGNKLIGKGNLLSSLVNQ